MLQKNQDVLVGNLPLYPLLLSRNLELLLEVKITAEKRAIPEEGYL
jgi:hypothetical protein